VDKRKKVRRSLDQDVEHIQECISEYEPEAIICTIDRLIHRLPHVADVHKRSLVDRRVYTSWSHEMVMRWVKILCK
jgi:hypothetical protein